MSVKASKKPCSKNNRGRESQEKHNKKVEFDFIFTVSPCLPRVPGGFPLRTRRKDRQQGSQWEGLENRKPTVLAINHHSHDSSCSHMTLASLGLRKVIWMPSDDVPCTHSVHSAVP